MLPLSNLRVAESTRENVGSVQSSASGGGCQPEQTITVLLAKSVLHAPA